MPFHAQTPSPKVFRHYLEEEVYSLLRRRDGAFFDWLQLGNLDGVWYWDLEQPQQEWYSDKLIDFLGFTPQEIQYTPEFWKSRIFPDDLPETESGISQHLQDAAHPFDQIVRFRHKDGRTLWIRCRGIALRDEGGKPVRFLGTHQDVTALKKAQRDLSEALEDTVGKLDAFRIASPDLTCLIDKNGYYVDVASGVNVPALDEPSKIVGRKVLEVGTPAYARQTWQHAQRAMETGSVITWVFQAPSRPELSYEARFVRSSPEECLVLVRDVTDQEASRLSLETAVQKRTEELQMSNDELRQFAYAASHDLREPLLKVKAFGQRLAEKYGDRLDEKGQRYLEVMLNATERMQTLMDDLLDYSRVGRFEDPFEQVDLNVVVEKVLEDLDQRSEGATIHVGALPVVWADKVQMGLVFQNLLTNSIKFHKPEVPPQVTISAAEVGDDWVVSVSDKGIGFDMQYRDKIFQLFERLHTRFDYPGTGIGLALCKKVMDRHQGWIQCESEPGEGATFHVGLPKCNT